MADRVNWTSVMDDYLRQNYIHTDEKTIVDHLGVNRSAMYRRLKKLGIDGKHEAGTALHPMYTKEEDELITTLGYMIGAKGLSTLMNRSIESIWNRAKDMKVKLTEQDYWTATEDFFLAKYMDHLSYQNIGRLLERGYEATRKRAELIGLNRDKKKSTVMSEGRVWLAFEHYILFGVIRGEIPKDYVQLASVLDRTPEAVTQRIKFLKTNYTIPEGTAGQFDAPSSHLYIKLMERFEELKEAERSTVL